MICTVCTRYEQVELDRRRVVSSRGVGRIGPHWDDGATAGIDRDVLHRRGRVDVALPAYEHIGVPVVPVARGQVYLPGSQPGREYGRYQQVWPQQVFVVDVAHRRVILVLEDEWALNWCTGFSSSDERGVDIRQQAVTQTDRIAHHVQHDVAPGPGVLVDVPELRMVATEWGQHAVLHPAEK